MDTRSALLAAIGAATLVAASASTAAGSADERTRCSISTGPAATIYGMAAVSPRDIWAVGTAIEHFNGSSWSLVDGLDGGLLFGVAATSARDAWAVGQTADGAAMVAHWDGGAWRLMPAAQPAGRTAWLSGVAALSPSNLWAVGGIGSPMGGARRTLVEHYDGQAWHIVSSRNPGAEAWLSGIAAAGPGNLWAVGGRVAQDGLQRSLIEHWDGAAWSWLPAPDPVGRPLAGQFPALSAVAARTARDVWAVGIGANSLSLVEHFNGAAWSVVPSANVNVNVPPSRSANQLLGVAIRSAGDVFAVGAADGQFVVAEHWDGDSWRLLPRVHPGGDARLFAAVAIGDQLVAGGDWNEGASAFFERCDG